MKKIIVGLLIGLLVISCKDKDTYTITGLANGIEDGTKVVLYNDLSESTVVDSTLVKSGAFKLEGHVDTITLVTFLSLQTKDGERIGKSELLVLEPGDIKATFADEKFSISGTPLNDNNLNFNNRIEKLDREAQLTEVKTFILENIDNALGAFYFSVAFPVFELEEVADVLKQIPAEYKKSEIMQEIQAQIKMLEETSVVGKPYKDIQGLSLAGKELKLSDFAGKGKIVLVDFWASWCPPCIKDMPHMKEIYEKYKNQGFEIVGVSLDDNKEAWAGATNKFKLPWPQFSNLKGWDEDGARTYNVRGIPYTILIDKDGTIVAESLRGDQISQKIEELLKK